MTLFGLLCTPTADVPPNSARKSFVACSFPTLLALAVWIIWLAFGGRTAVGHFVSDWRIALTMLVGSFVGGGTSTGGGAVAFPVFTKLLHIAPADARNFSLAIKALAWVLQPLASSIYASG